ncbi:hypothetical protein H6P81_019839 [Aristolochia fimbriata]|uniref:Uncharacterized protein n=1 Tax=Aristolochia fimbriata TaxID=158543 RepID=A0AAV7DUN4_ARIFI|nr:hypothetical protein H6P81_019839 [Aristolochia fimbriata]
MTTSNSSEMQVHIRAAFLLPPGVLISSCNKPSSRIQMAASRWIKPEVYPLMAAMTFVTGMCVFQLARNVLFNPDVRINKAHRSQSVLENGEEGERYAMHGLRRFLHRRPPEIMPTINAFFSDHK